jgi:hypothetical protein
MSEDKISEDAKKKREKELEEEERKNRIKVRKKTVFRILDILILIRIL